MGELTRYIPPIANALWMGHPAGVRGAGFLMFCGGYPIRESEHLLLESGRTTIARRQDLHAAPQEKNQMKNIKLVFATFVKDESGQDLIEYALVAGLIGLGAIVAMTGLATKIGTAFNAVGNSLTNSI